MKILLGFLTTLLPILYLVLFAGYYRVFQKDEKSTALWSRRLLVLTLIVHLFTLAGRTYVFGRIPLASPLEFCSLLALAVTGLYLVIELRIKAPQTGFVVMALAFILQFLSSAFAGMKTVDDPLLHEAGFATHAVLILLSYTALCIGFIYALLYLLLARQLTRRNFGLLYRRMPALDTLERMSVGAVKLCVPLMLAALVTGHLWLEKLKERVDPEVAQKLSHADPKIVASWVILLAYFLGLVGHQFLGWRGRRMNLLAIGAFVLVIITMAVIHHFIPSFHNFSIRGEG